MSPVPKAANDVKRRKERPAFVSRVVVPPTRRRQLGRWLAGKGDTVAEEFAKAFGKSLGTSAGVGLVALLIGGAIFTVLQFVVHSLG